MKSNTKFSLAIVTALAMAAMGCGDSGGTGGTGGLGGTAGLGGMGGMGGTDPGSAMLRLAHLAPEIPSDTDTAIDILLDGSPVVEDLVFAEATEFMEFAAGEYTFDIAEAGSTDALFSFDARLDDGLIATIVVIRSVVASGEANPVNVLGFEGDTDGLPQDRGRVHVGHGADDTRLEEVDLILTNPMACPPALVQGLLYGTVDGPPDLPADSYNIGIAAPLTCDSLVGALVNDVTAGVVALLIAVDNDIRNTFVDLAIYNIEADFSGEGIPTLEQVIEP